MILKEIYDKKWKISKDLKVTYSLIKSIPKEEQECHFNILKEGFNSDTTEILFCCSFQEYINKLLKSELVLVKEVLISRTTNYLLQVKGNLNKNGITIRKGTYNVPKEEQLKRIENLVRYRARIKKG